ncbi:MAG TPA: hypothetical protein VN030_15135 [Cellvibrio sp.]|nr:hypothetical protein [Cellvibrio sp.]
MLTLADLLNLIRLTELELDKLQIAVTSDDESIRNNAGEIIIQMDKLSQKLRLMYETSRQDIDDYPTYDNYIAIIEKTKIN